LEDCKNGAVRPVAILFEERRDQTSTKVGTKSSVLALVSVLEIALAQSLEVSADSGIHAIESRDGGYLCGSFRVRLVIPVVYSLLQSGSSLIFSLFDLKSARQILPPQT